MWTLYSVGFKTKPIACGARVKTNYDRGRERWDQHHKRPVPCQAWDAQVCWFAGCSIFITWHEISLILTKSTLVLSNIIPKKKHFVLQCIPVLYHCTGGLGSMWEVNEMTEFANNIIYIFKKYIKLNSISTCKHLQSLYIYTTGK